MQALRIRRQLDSETVPELKPWVGRKVEIIVMDDAGLPHSSVVRPGSCDWAAFEKIAAELRETYDFDAIKDQEACDLRHANDHLP
ncbi:MAG: hypothetical protein IAF94_10285 [Pirellulaceae bacterium]|nr:hypothetical protein [Pirellulaceae bacterium]